MRYAEVSVNSPVAQRGTFSYSIPSGLNVAVGQAVWVPFGDKLLQGIVLELTDYPAVEETRDIAGIIESCPPIPSSHLVLARWMSDYYLSPLFDAVSLVLPPGFERKVKTFLSVNPASLEQPLPVLMPVQDEIFQLVRGLGKVSLRELEKKFGIRRGRLAVTALVKQGLLSRSYEPEKIKVKPKQVPYLRLAVPVAQATTEVTNLLGRNRAVKQAHLLEYLADLSHPVPLAEVKKATGCSSAIVAAVVRKGLAVIELVEVPRLLISYDRLTPANPWPLTVAQKSALESIKSGLLQAVAGSGSPPVFLLHGVTGSGKTEVYLQALAETVRRGRRGIVLVPEIALTPQTIERFAARFPGRVAVLHSKLSLGEQFDEWRRIRNGEVDVVIGPRSAVFAPQPDLGLIVIDEEHEWAYKQADKSPHYHARDVAIKLAELAGVVVVLGSATPDVETYYRARSGGYTLLALPERVTPVAGAALPNIEVVDLREELKAGNSGLFSRSLSEAMAGALAREEQVILFLNRRGAATFIQCRSCGLVLRCRRCGLPLTYHSDDDVLVCHHCNRKFKVPVACPRCARQQLKFLGVGTQRLEQEVKITFPRARLLRWDSDTVVGKGAHKAILDRFRAHEADILIGTQLVAKGLDLPLVTLVGVVNADTGINLPDFRAGERTFQLVSQVAGRAGRGMAGGRVIIQTYSPEHYVIKAAANHDYSGFYEREIDYRRQLRNPPFSQLVSLVYTHTNDTICQREAERLKALLVQEIAGRGVADVSVLGPAPAFIQRLRGRFRWQLILRGSGLSDFLEAVPLPREWVVDVDPVGI